MNKKVNRRSIRLKGYDYSRAGLYYITICTQNRQCLLGRVENQQMILNDAGRMVKQWYYEIENKYPDKKCHEMVIMPNHIHFIIENVPVGADLCVCPDNKNVVCPDNKNAICPNHPNPDSFDNNNGIHHNERTNTFNERTNTFNERTNTFNERTNMFNQRANTQVRPYGVATIPMVVQWFKTMTTNAYIRGVKNHQWEPYNEKLWQRNYWEHIIRNNLSYANIATYILQNPQKWDNDSLNNETNI